GAGARPRRRAVAGGVQRDHLVPRRRHRVRATGPLRARPGPAVDVLRAVQPRAEHRGPALLDHDPRPAGSLRRPHPREDAGSARPPRRHGAAPRHAGVPRRLRLLRRRHRALRVHARVARGRHRPRGVPGHPCLARPRRGPAGPRAHRGVAPGRADGRLARVRISVKGVTLVKRAAAIGAVALIPSLAIAGAAGAAGRQSQAAICARASLPLVQSGTLPIGTDNPAFPPWFGGGEHSKPWKFNDPTTGKGYESAVAYAVARQMGFTRNQVKWVVVPFATSFAPGKKKFDMLLNQVSFSPQRAKNVNFSASDYDVKQAVVTLKGKRISNVKSIAGLKPFKLGAPIGTTSFEVITKRVKPDQQPAVFDTLNDGVNALRNGTIDGLVVDLPTGF